MQDIKLECTFDGIEYKEYKVLSNNQPLGIVSWSGSPATAAACWYITASDGNLRHFQTQSEAIDFLKSGSLESVAELSTQLKVEAQKLTSMATDLEAQSTLVEVQEEALKNQVAELKSEVADLKAELKAQGE